jgi:hypothetical protein
MVRNPKSRKGGACRDQGGDLSSMGKKEGEGPWPELCQFSDEGGGLFRISKDLLRIGEVADDGVVGGPSFDFEDSFYRLFIQGVGAEAVDRLRGEGHHFSHSDQTGRFFEVYIGSSHRAHLLSFIFGERMGTPVPVKSTGALWREKKCVDCSNIFCTFILPWDLFRDDSPAKWFRGSGGR